MDVDGQGIGLAGRAPKANDYPPDVAADSEPDASDEKRPSATHGRSSRLSALVETPRHRADDADLHRFVFRYRGHGHSPVEDMATIESGVRVLDRTSRMVLVEASGPQVARLVTALPRWMVAEEQVFSLAGRRTRGTLASGPRRIGGHTRRDGDDAVGLS